MAKSLKEIVSEVLDAISECPEDLKPQAFEILLRHQLGPSRPSRSGELADHRDVVDEVDEVPDEADIAEPELHAKTRKFLKDHGVTIADINALYYREGDEIKPLYDDLGSAVMSECQLRLALLEALETAFETGAFEFRGESVREKCKIYKCYDSPNFTRNFKSNQALLDGYEKYDRGARIRLSTAGKSRLAEVIKELAR